MKTTARNITYPRVNVKETEEKYLLSVEVPGAKADSIDVTVEQGLLKITAERDLTAPAEAKLVYQEFGSASFSRSFQLPELVDRDHISAKAENGVLQIELTKVKKEARKIVVQA